MSRPTAPTSFSAPGLTKAPGATPRKKGAGLSGRFSIPRRLAATPDATDFVKKTGVDALAVAIGTSHGAYKFTRPPTGDILAIQRIKKINARIPNTHLVMHGSSSVP